MKGYKLSRFDFFLGVVENPEFSSLPSFLFGQSMGGAVSLKIHFKQPDAWTGAVLVAPMCKVMTFLKNLHCHHYIKHD